MTKKTSTPMNPPATPREARVEQDDEHDGEATHALDVRTETLGSCRVEDGRRLELRRPGSLTSVGGPADPRRGAAAIDSRRERAARRDRSRCARDRPDR